MHENILLKSKTSILSRRKSKNKESGKIDIKSLMHKLYVSFLFLKNSQQLRFENHKLI